MSSLPRCKSIQWPAPASASSSLKRPRWRGKGCMFCKLSSHSPLARCGAPPRSLLDPRELVRKVLGPGAVGLDSVEGPRGVRGVERRENTVAVVLRPSEGRPRRKEGRESGLARARRDAALPARDSGKGCPNPSSRNTHPVLTYLESCSRSPDAPVTMMVMYLALRYSLPSADTAALSTAPVTAS